MATAGQRVRVTTEGVITWASNSGLVFEVEGIGFDTAVKGVSFELIADPLPSTPGSVVRQGNTFFHINRDGDWIDDGGNDYSAAELLGSGTPVTILFVAA